MRVKLQDCEARYREELQETEDENRILKKQVDATDRDIELLKADLHKTQKDLQERDAAVQAHAQRVNQIELGVHEANKTTDEIASEKVRLEDMVRNLRESQQDKDAHAKNQRERLEEEVRILAERKREESKEWDNERALLQKRCREVTTALEDQGEKLDHAEATVKRHVLRVEGRTTKSSVLAVN